MSPELNPTEMVWDTLDFRVKEKQPTSAQHFWELLQECCKTIPKDKLVKVMMESKVCKKLVSNQKVATS